MSKPSLKILHVVVSLNLQNGGVSQAVRSMIKSLAPHAITNEVLVLEELTDDISDLDTRVTCIGPGRGPWSYSVRMRYWLRAHLGNYDVVMVHGLWLYPGYAIYQALNRLKKRALSNKGVSVPKLIVMPHGMLDPYFQKSRKRMVKAIRNNIYWKLIELNLVNSADAMLFTTEIERELAKITFTPYRPKDAVVIGFGIEEPPVFDPVMKRAFDQAVPSVSGKPFFLYLSRIHEKKGLDLLLTAYEKMIKVGKNAALPALVVAGPGLDLPYGKTIAAMVNRSAELKSRVVFAGMLKGDAKWGSIYGCEAFVLPSHQENFGIAVVESLACSKPALISDQINIWKEIEKEGGGLIGKDTVAGALGLLEQYQALSDEQKGVMSRSARRCFEEHFEMDHFAAKLAGYLEKMRGPGKAAS